jgi:hypothetical protein
MTLLYWLDAGVGLPSPTLSHLFDLNGEGTIPAWFSSVQLAFLAVALFLLRATQSHGKYWGLLVLSVLTMFFSVDEMLSMHERLNEVLITVPGFPRFKYNNGAWLIIYLPVLAFVGMICLRDMLALRVRFPAEVLSLCLGVGLALLGAAGLEVISYQFFFLDQQGFWYQLEVGLEELLEMAGVSLMLCSVTSMLERMLVSDSHQDNHS